MTNKSENLAEQLDDEEVKEILKSGTDLRKYSHQIEKDFKNVENQSIINYIQQSHNIASLHNQIGDCDQILERMESMLMNFQVRRTQRTIKVFEFNKTKILECLEQHKYRNNNSSKEVCPNVSSFNQSSINKSSIVPIY